MKIPGRLSTLAALALASALAASPALAQPGFGPGGGAGYGPGHMMMGPGMMSGRGMRTMCSPRAAGFAEWRLDRLERLIQPTADQKTKLEELRKSTAAAAEAMAAACPKEPPATPIAHLDFMEKRAEAMHASIKSVRPAFEAFFGSLTDEQKAKLTSGRRQRGWHFFQR